MSATETATATKSDNPTRSALERVGSIPLVSGTLQQAHSALLSNSYSASIYNRGSGLAISLYTSYGIPVQNKFHAPLVQVNAYANGTLDWAEKKWPYPFQHTGEEIVGDAAQQAKLAYEAQVQQARVTISGIAERLTTALESVPGGHQAGQAAVALQERIASQVDGLRHVIITKSTDLSIETQKSIAPFIDTLSRHLGEVKKQALDADKPLAERATSLLAYLKTEAIPAFNDAAEKIKAVLVKKKDEAEKVADEKRDSASVSTDALKEKVSSKTKKLNREIKDKAQQQQKQVQQN